MLSSLANKLHILEVATLFGATQAYFMRGYDELLSIKTIHARKMKIVAKGIETEDEFNTMKELGADFFQGIG